VILVFFARTIEKLQGTEMGRKVGVARETPLARHGGIRYAFLRRAMHIGFTYDLRSDYLALGYGEEETAEFDKEETIAALEAELQSLGHRVERIGHVRALASRLSTGHRWDLVFNICEGLRGTGREAQVPALLDAFDIPYVFSGPVTLGLTLDKALTKHVIQNLRIPTADFTVIERPEDVLQVALPFPLFLKPISEGTGKGISPRSRVCDQSALEEVACDLLDRFRQPVLVERYLPGREFTTGVVGHGLRARALGTMEVLFTGAAEANDYSYLNKADYVGRVEYRAVLGQLATECAHVAVAAWRGLGCVDGGRVDLRMDDAGRVCFIEVNPLAGLNPIHSDLPILAGLHGISYHELIEEIMRQAEERLGLRP
jgi:D-alanine-D-alanine ligase